MNFLSTDIFETEELELKMEKDPGSDEQEEKICASNVRNDKRHSLEINDPEIDENGSDCEERLVKKSFLSSCLEMYRARFSKSHRLLPYFFEDDIVVVFQNFFSPFDIHQ